MENSLVLVSDPDYYTGGDFRILLAGVSNVNTVDIIRFYSELDQETVIHTVTNDNYDWIAKTAQTCDVIILNLDEINNLIAGYLLSNKKTVWYSAKKDFSILNTKQIFDPLTYLVQRRTLEEFRTNG